MSETISIEVSVQFANFIRELQKRVLTQDECFTRTPLYCVYERRNADDEQNGAGWPVSFFLTAERAESYMKAIHYRLTHPYIYVCGPGEDSDLHTLMVLVKEMQIPERL